MSEARAQTEFKVAMTCDGCARAVRAILSKTEGVQNVDIDVAAQKVVVTGSASSGADRSPCPAPRSSSLDVLLAAIKRTGKKTDFVSRSA